MYIVRYIEQRKLITQETLLFHQFFPKQMPYGIFFPKIKFGVD